VARRPTKGREEMHKVPIRIPYSKSREANERKYGQASTSYKQCLLCARPIRGVSMKVVVLSSDLGEIIDPQSPEGQGEDNGGAFFIGPDCWKTNRQLHPYEVKE
jgi:hypothetical protein